MLFEYLQCKSSDGGKYICNIDNLNRFFCECDKFIVHSSDFKDISNISNVVKDLHFEYVLKGNEIIGPNIPVKFILMNKGQIDDWYQCNIKRPTEINPRSGAVRDIRLIFHSSYNLEATFYIKSYNENNIPKPTSFTTLEIYIYIYTNMYILLVR
jgi:hypothetical protein